MVAMGGISLAVLRRQFSFPYRLLFLVLVRLVVLGKISVGSAPQVLVRRAGLTGSIEGVRTSAISVNASLPQTIRFVFAAIKRRGEIPLVDLAAVLGLPAGSIRYFVGFLESRGWVVVGEGKVVLTEQGRSRDGS